MIDKLDEINFSITQKIRTLRQSEKISEEELQRLKLEVHDLLEAVQRLQFLSEIEDRQPKEQVTSSKSQAHKTEKYEPIEHKTETTEETVDLNSGAEESDTEEATEDIQEYAASLENEINNTISSHSSNPSIGDRYSKDDNSLADRFRKKKLESLKDAMGINEKFLFTNELFSGNTEIFFQEIEILNNKNSLEEAKTHFKKLETKHEWDSEGKAHSLLYELIERRYL